MESTVVYDLKWLFTFCDPMYKLSPDNLHDQGFNLAPIKIRLTVPQLWCVGNGCK
jgi:hypothetical protein